MNHPLPTPVNDDEARVNESLTEDESTVSLADLEAGAPPLAAPNGARRRQRWMLASLLLVLLLGGAGVGAYFLATGQRVDVRANRRTTPTATNGSGIQRAAFASLSEALGPAPVATTGAAVTATTTAGPPAVPAVNIGSGQDAEVTMAGVPKTKEALSAGAESVPAPPPANVQAGIAATLAPPPEVLLPQTNQAKNNPSGQRNSEGNKPNVQPQPNPAHSLRFAPLPTPEPTPAQTGSRGATDRRPVPVNQNDQADRFTPVPAALRQRAPAPAFGTMLPVRLLGVLHTLRPGALARLELLRDIPTERGTVKRGTVFIGAVTSGEMNRAYVQIKGFIAAESGGFIKLGGEVLGNDGGAGLPGKQRRVAPVWGKVLDRSVQVGTQLATAILGRQNSSVVIASDPYGTYRATAGQSAGQFGQNRTFVQVAAGAVGFILVTTLPAVETETHLARNPPSLLANTVLPGGEWPGASNANALADEELAELIAEADPARLRAALPRMQPELRKLAQAVLAEIEPGKKP